MKLTKSILTLAFVGAATMAHLGAEAAVTPYFAVGTTCTGLPTGAVSTSYTTSGPAVQVSLCVNTTLAAEKLCGHSTFMTSAAAGQNGLFNVTARNLGAFTDSTSTFSTPIPISTPNSGGFDFGGIPNPYAPTAAPANIVLQTFDITPTAGATAASYVLSVAAGSIVAVDTDGVCGAPAGTTTAGTSFTLNLSAAPIITSGAPAGATVNNAYSHTFTATGSPAPTFSVTAGTIPTGMNPLTAGGVLAGTPTATGTFNFTVTASNGVNPAATQAVTLVVSAASQTITFANPGARAFSTTPFASGATASSGLTVALTSTTPTVCTVSGLNITMVSAGSCTINANQPGNASFGAAPQVSQTFTINAVAPGAPTVSAAAGNLQGTLTITPPAFTGGVAVGTLTYAATCTPAGGTDTNTGTTSLTHVITGLANGTPYTCTVIATNGAGPGPASAASNSFTPSPTPVPPAFTSPATLSGNVGTAIPTFNITATGVPSPTITAGVAPSGLTFTSGGANTGTAAITGTPTTAGTFNFTLTATGTAPAATQNLVITIAAAAQTITFTGPAAQTFSTTPVTVSATASSGLTVAFTSTTPTICTVSGTSVTMVTVGTCTIAANQAGNTNFAAAPQVTQSFVISQGSQTITFGAQAARGFSATAVPLSPLATASSGLPITYTSTTPAVCSVTGSSVLSLTQGTCTVQAAQAGNTNFAAATPVTQNITITIGSQTISFSPAPFRLGSAATLNGTASSGLPVSYVSTTAATCTVAGNVLTPVAVGVCSLTASQAGNANFSAAPNVTVAVQVIPPGTVTLSSSRNPAPYRAPTILTAAIDGLNPTGTVTFSLLVNGVQTPICSAVPLVSGSASCNVPGSLNTTNPVNYTAEYSGDGQNNPSQTFAQQLVDLNAVTVSAVSNPLQVGPGRTVSLRAMVVGRTLTSGVQFNENGVSLPGCASVPVSLLPGATDMGVAVCNIASVAAGNHNYVVTYPSAPTAGFSQVIVPVNVASAAPQDYNDMWWVGQSENGWGISITQHGSAERAQQFIVFFVYDNAGKPIWYAMPGGTFTTPTSFTGALYQPTSSPFSSYNTANFLPGGITGASVGTATVTYTSPSAATVNYTINGISGSKSIIRQVFATDDGQPRLQVNDLWWAGQSENGWGLNITQQGRQLFPLWYTYGSNGVTTWFGVPGGTWNGNVFTGEIFSTTSSGWLGTNYVAQNFTGTKVGTMTLTFTDQSNAIMTYTVNGLTQSKIISRQPF